MPERVWKSSGWTSGATHERSFADLVNELLTVSPEFRRWWTSPFVHPTVDGVKRFWSSDGRAVDYSYSVLSLSENQSQRLVVFIPAEKADPMQGVSYALKPNGNGSALSPIRPG